MLIHKTNHHHPPQKMNMDNNEYDLITYHKNNQIKSILHFKNKKKEGEQKYYNEARELTESIEYKDNMKHGKHKFYTGDVCSEEYTYIHNENTGVNIEYYNNKKTKTIWNTENGIHHGKSILYTPNGKVVCIDNYYKGSLSGIQMWFDSFLNITQYNTYVLKNNNQYAFRIEFENQRIYKTYYQLNDQTVGKLFMYYPDGNLKTYSDYNYFDKPKLSSLVFNENRMIQYMTFDSLKFNERHRFDNNGTRRIKFDNIRIENGSSYFITIQTKICIRKIQNKYRKKYINNMKNIMLMNTNLYNNVLDIIMNYAFQFNNIFELDHSLLHGGCG